MKEQLWFGITDGGMKSRLRDYRDRNPNWGTQEAVDHLSLHDSRDVATKALEMAVGTGSINALYAVSEGSGYCTGSDSSDHDSEYFQEEGTQNRQGNGSSGARGARGVRGSFVRSYGTRRGGFGAGGQFSNGQNSASNRGGRSGTMGRDAFVGKPQRFMTFGSFDTIVDGLREVTLEVRDGKRGDTTFCEPDARKTTRSPAPPAVGKLEQRGGWRGARAGQKPYQPERKPRTTPVNLCRGCGLYTVQPLTGKCVYGKSHFCIECGDVTDFDCLLCVSDADHGIDPGHDFVVYDGDMGKA